MPRDSLKCWCRGFQIPNRKQGQKKHRRGSPHCQGSMSVKRGVLAGGHRLSRRQREVSRELQPTTHTPRHEPRPQAPRCRGPIRTAGASQSQPRDRTAPPSHLPPLVIVKLGVQRSVSSNSDPHTPACLGSFRPPPCSPHQSPAGLINLQMPRLHPGEPQELGI